MFLMSATNLFSQNTNNVIKVQGEAIIRVTPEILVVNIPIQAKDSVYEKCTKKLVDKYNRLKAALVKNNIKEETIKSDNLSVNENYIWDQRERKFDGYIGSLQVSLELNYSADKLSAIIQTLKEDEFKFGYSISFKLSEKQKSEQLENAINIAVADAMNKAKMIAKSLQIKLGKIQEINFGYNTPTYGPLAREENYAVLSKAGNEANDLQLNLNPQLIEIQKSIGIIWNIIQ